MMGMEHKDKEIIDLNQKKRQWWKYKFYYKIKRDEYKFCKDYNSKFYKIVDSYLPIKIANDELITTNIARHIRAPWHWCDIKVSLEQIVDHQTQSINGRPQIHSWQDQQLLKTRYRIKVCH